ncbi:MAG: molybdopterin-guanine dinucleotide biosynthesis protein MobB, partial [Oscillospiraceae bacterium]
MRIFTVRGITKSGKTTTIEKVISELKKRGYSVGSVKEIHYKQFKIDPEGTNTDRHKKAGSELVTARGDF